LTFFCALGEKFDILGEKFDMILYAYLLSKLNMNRFGEAWGKNLTSWGKNFTFFCALGENFDILGENFHIFWSRLDPKV